MSCSRACRNDMVTGWRSMNRTGGLRFVYTRLRAGNRKPDASQRSTCLPGLIGRGGDPASSGASDFLPPNTDLSFLNQFMSV